MALVDGREDFLVDKVSAGGDDGLLFFGPVIVEFKEVLCDALHGEILV